MLFLFEYATCTLSSLPPSIAVEGLAMFRAIKESMEEEPRSFVNPSFSSQFPCFPPARGGDFSKALEECDSALVVAPESEGRLLDFTRRVEKAGVRNLGSSSKAVKACSDKYRALRKLRGIRTPQTEVFNGSTSLDFPLVAKPRFGEGGEGVFVVNSQEEMGRVPRGYLVQEYVNGQSASATFFASSNGISLLSTQRQHLEGFSYQGSTLPLKVESEKLLEAVRGIEGLRGFFGMDFVLTREGPVAMEINPRPTTSMAGLKEAFNLSYGDFDRGVVPGRGKKVKIEKIKGKIENSYASSGEYSIVVRSRDEDFEL